MIRQTLHDAGWTARAAGDLAAVPEALRGRDLPAAVPGCIHTDLLAAGLIEDPYLGRNEYDLQWIGRADWRYRCTFDVEPAALERARVELACDGLDTVAELMLNGQPIGAAQDQHIAYRFDVKPALRATDNELVITFRSALRHAEEKAAGFQPMPFSPYEFNHPRPYIRKMQCNFGWDWGATLVTCGVWKPIRIEAWDGVRIASVRPLITRADAERAELAVHVDADGKAEVKATLTAPGGSTITASGPSDRPLALAVDRPSLWWPVGHGDQPLYTLRVEAGGDQWSRRIGLRTVELDTSPDDPAAPDAGTRFALRVNGKPIYCRGANWIPDDCFPTRVDRDRYARRIGQAIGCGMNMLRVWGGGIFETDDFYDVCDECGVMVWQDFLFACACYPEDEPYWSLVETEARQNVARLSCHPSLVIWNGCNENLWMYGKWAREQRQADQRWGTGYYFDLLPRVCREVDPSRPYWPASPYSGRDDLDPNDQHHGNKHMWEVWFGGPPENYRTQLPRFCSEFGYQAPPTHATLVRAVGEANTAFGGDAMKQRQKSPNGDRVNLERVEEAFGAIPGTDDLYYLMQVNQARALKTGVEWFRAHAGRNMGALYWQLNDCWPVVSWSAVDGDERLKPLWYETRRFFADRLLTLQPLGFGQPVHGVYAHNDHDQPWRGDLVVRRTGFDGRVLAERTQPVDLAPRQAACLLVLDDELRTPADAAAEMIVAELDGAERALWFFDFDRGLRYPAPAFESSVEARSGGARLTVAAASLVRDLCVFVDRLDPAATISDQLVTLLPGESHTFEIDSPTHLDEAALTAPPVLQCVNRLTAGR